MIRQCLWHNVKIDILCPRVITLAFYGNRRTCLALCVHILVILVRQGIIPALHKLQYLSHFTVLIVSLDNQTSVRSNRAVKHPHFRFDRAARINLVSHRDHIEALFCSDLLIVGINMGFLHIDRLICRKHTSLSTGSGIPAPENLSGKLSMLRHPLPAYAFPISQGQPLCHSSVLVVKNDIARLHRHMIRRRISRHRSRNHCRPCTLCRHPAVFHSCCLLVGTAPANAVVRRGILRPVLRIQTDALPLEQIRLNSPLFRTGI